ncbi:hypothetical protein [Mesorhizobium sp.]|uniref:hypothetical protein n=1 Tax=Mesorhizobium sp. TaxID=1871066 RepID=UPI000FE496A6|nr:hypothetical protein [Mesorhizobium sp.]RWP79961.1 MAG: hypothetical protein EOR09_01810 [Mesorhizobium sp.]RWQ65638.1 MAG: hypothetical protein EOS86_13865 [Mesorhizobium sp.]
MKQSRKGESKERLVDILMYGWATSKDPDMLLLAKGLPEAKLPNLSCRIDNELARSNGKAPGSPGRAP